MTAAQTKIPVRYVGSLPRWSDHLYGSNLSFRRGKATGCPPWAAALLLKHPEFQDDRPEAERGQPIVAPKPKSEDPEKEALELMEIDTNVRLDQMTKAQQVHFAQRAFGVLLDPTDLKVDLTDRVRSLMRERGV
jgi:hypothetical protein